MTNEASFFLDILDERGIPDMRIINEMRKNKEPFPTTGSYRITEFADKGYHLYGMNRPLRLAAYRKLSNFPMEFEIFDECVQFETYYSLNNSDTDPYLLRVRATATIDQLVLEYDGDQRLKVAQYERSFVRTPDEDEYSPLWFAAMEQKIIRREPADRYPYSLRRTMSVAYKTVRARELALDRHQPERPPAGVTRRLPDEQELLNLPEELTTTREIGRVFYKLLSKQYFTIEQLSEMVDELLEHYTVAKKT